MFFSGLASQFVCGTTSEFSRRRLYDDPPLLMVSKVKGKSSRKRFSAQKPLPDSLSCKGCKGFRVKNVKRKECKDLAARFEARRPLRGPPD
jgi:hypothetical protein